MNNNEMWESTVRSAGDLVGVFEFDGETGYFYLYQTSQSVGQKVIGSIHIVSGTPDFGQEDIDIHWTKDEKLVGLFIRSQLWAAFKYNSGAKFGGGYQADKSPSIPLEILRSFE